MSPTFFAKLPLAVALLIASMVALVAVSAPRSAAQFEVAANALPMLAGYTHQ